MTAEEAIEEFLRLYVLPGERDNARPALASMMRLAHVRGALAESDSTTDPASRIDRPGILKVPVIGHVITSARHGIPRLRPPRSAEVPPLVSNEMYYISNTYSARMDLDLHIASTAVRQR